MITPLSLLSWIPFEEPIFDHRCEYVRTTHLFVVRPPLPAVEVVWECYFPREVTVSLETISPIDYSATIGHKLASGCRRSHKAQLITHFNHASCTPIDSKIGKLIQDHYLMEIFGSEVTGNHSHRQMRKFNISCHITRHCDLCENAVPLRNSPCIGKWGGLCCQCFWFPCWTHLQVTVPLRWIYRRWYPLPRSRDQCSL